MSGLSPQNVTKLTLDKFTGKKTALRRGNMWTCLKSALWRSADLSQTSLQSCTLAKEKVTRRTWGRTDECHRLCVRSVSRRCHVSACWHDCFSTTRFKAYKLGVNVNQNWRLHYQVAILRRNWFEFCSGTSTTASNHFWPPLYVLDLLIDFTFTMCCGWHECQWE
jgi:hypothetical protein